MTLVERAEYGISTGQLKIPQCSFIGVKNITIIKKGFKNV